MLVWENWRKTSRAELRSVNVHLIDHEPPWLPPATFVHELGLLTSLPVSIAWVPLLGNLENSEIPFLNVLPESWMKMRSSSCYFVAERQLHDAPAEDLAIDELEWTKQPGFGKLSAIHGDDSGGDDGGGAGGGGEPNWKNQNYYSLLSDALQLESLKKKTDRCWENLVLDAVQELASDASAPLRLPVTYL